MQTNIFFPRDKRLRNYIEYFWLLQDEATGNEPGCSIVSPEAAFDVILSFAGSTVWETKSQRQLQIKDSFLGGIRQDPFLINCQNPVDYLAIRFYPDKFYQLLAFPLSEIFDQVVELDLFAGPFWRHLTEKIAGIPDIKHRIAALEAEFLALLKTGSEHDSRLFEGALTHIHTSQGRINIQQVCEQLGVYPKRLEREFKKYIGVPPKFYSRIVRFNQVFEYINRQPADIEWTDIVYEFGYFDQPHFIKEFTRFLGLSPEQYQAMRQEMVEADFNL